jgi:hypothetical protein
MRPALSLLVLIRGERQGELLEPLSPAQRKQFIELGRLVADWRA